MTKIEYHYIAHRLNQRTKQLYSQHILMINKALGAVGEFGEVHLKVENGCLRFVITQASHDTLKYQPGELSLEG